MSPSISIEGIVPGDQTYLKMSAVYSACLEAGLRVPVEVLQFFEYEKPDALGMRVNLKNHIAVTKFGDAGGFEIELELLEPKFKFIRISNSI
jgi:hypothetical protein